MHYTVHRRKNQACRRTEEAGGSGKADSIFVAPIAVSGVEEVVAAVMLPHEGRLHHTAFPVHVILEQADLCVHLHSDGVIGAPPGSRTMSVRQAV